jgi:hypothetical protein
VQDATPWRPAPTDYAYALRRDTPARGQCRRYAPAIGQPSVRPEHWCGEFALSDYERALADMDALPGDPPPESIFDD